MMIDGTDYTLRTSRWGAYVRYQNECVKPEDLRILLATTHYSINKKLRITQGGLSNGSLSGNTHLRLGVYDLSIRGWTKQEVWSWCKIAQWNGIRPFPRGFTYDSFQGRTVSNIADGNEHLHVLVGPIFAQGHPARYQQLEYDKHGDGLVGPASYTGPWNSVKPWEDSPYNPANRVERVRDWTVNVAADSSLKGLDINRNVVLSRRAGDRITSIAEVKRWGRWNALTTSGNYYAMQYLTPIEKE